MHNIYVIGNGRSYIKRDFNGNPKETSSLELADVFENISIANKFLSSKLMRKFKSNGYIVMKNQDVLIENSAEVYNKLSQQCKNVNIHKGNTYIEQKEIDLAEMLSECVRVFSELDEYISNLEYYIRECEIKQDEINHYLREMDGRPNACGAAKLTYLRQPSKKNLKKKLQRERRLNSMKRWLKNTKIIRDWLNL